MSLVLADFDRNRMPAPQQTSMLVLALAWFDSSTNVRFSCRVMVTLLRCAPVHNVLIEVSTNTPNGFSACCFPCFAFARGFAAGRGIIFVAY